MNTVTGLRVGHGRDIHRLFAGAPLVLAGVPIACSKGFDTHSDGDVVCHALVDALAGALADGDLGTHFPEDDPTTAKARSLDFVRAYSDEIRARGAELVNLDAYVTIGVVKLLPYVHAMRLSLAEALRVGIGAISVKGRSGDGLGPEGRGDAASANVVVLLRTGGSHH